VTQVKLNAIHPNSIVESYVLAYQKLYKRHPKELRLLDEDWVIVNGARMRLSELAYLTTHLQKEYSQGLMDKRGALRRLINWLKK